VRVPLGQSVEQPHRQRLQGGLRHAALKGGRPNAHLLALPPSEGSQAKDWLAPS
jgi:hypothetical protein